MIEAVDAKLTKEGIREAYCLSGPAEVSDYEIFEEVFESVGDLFDRYTGSFYKLRNSNDNATMKMGMKPFAELADTAGLRRKRIRFQRDDKSPVGRRTDGYGYV